MKDPKIYIIGFLALLLVGGGFMLREQQSDLAGVQAQLQAEGSQVAELQTKLSAAARDQARVEADGVAERAGLAKRAKELEQRVAEIEPRAVAAERRASELEAKLAEAGRAAAKLEATVATAPGTPSAEQPKPSVAATLDSDTIKARAGELRLQVEQRYGAMADRLGLAPEQRDKLMTLIANKQQAANDATAASLQAGSDVIHDPAAFAALVAGARAESETQIHALLGDAAYAQYQQWDLAAGQSSTVARVQKALVATEPLDQAQQDQLQKLLDDNHVGHVTPKVIAGAQGFLSPAQMQALQGLFQEQQAAQQRRRAPQPPSGSGSN